MSSLIAHIVFRFDYGGLENGVVNIINGLSGERYRHAVIALTEATEFAERLQGDVEVISIGKSRGKDPGAYLRLYRELRRLRPAISHTRNIGTLDCAFVAFLARVPVRIHGEHGWDVFDPDGTSGRYRALRRFFYRFVHTAVTVSRDLERWLIEAVGIPAGKIRQIRNGVDTNRFRPGSPTNDPRDVVIGSVTRFTAIKDPLNLVGAFIDLRALHESLRLVMIGDGELLTEARQSLSDADLAPVTCLPGSRDDVAEQLQSMDVFVLGSLREGISNTVLEAMATGLPIVATDTGGNRELVVKGVNGLLVPPGDSKALGSAIEEYVGDAELRAAHGRASRELAESRFSISCMIDSYRQLYDDALRARGI